MPTGYSVMFSAKGGWQHIFGALEENDYRVEHAQHLGNRTSPNQWNNVFIPGHGMASGDTSAPGIHWLLKEIQDARQLKVKN